MLMERDLAALDAALSDGPRRARRSRRPRASGAGPRACSADAARPDEDFERAMRGRMEAGFPPQGRARRAPGRRRCASGCRGARPSCARGGLAPDGGDARADRGVVAVVLPGGPAVGRRRQRRVRGRRRFTEQKAPAAPESSSRARRRGEGRGPTPPRPACPWHPAAAAASPPAESNRRIERSVSLELGAPADEMERLADRVNAVTARYGGFVLSSSRELRRQDGAGGRLRPAHPGRPAASRAAGPGRPRRTALADAVGPRRDPSHVTLATRLRGRRGGAGRPAAPPGRGRHRPEAEAIRAPARRGGPPDRTAALPAARPAPRAPTTPPCWSRWPRTTARAERRRLLRRRRRRRR